MTESEYVRLLAMLQLGREELRGAANSSLLRLNDVQWNAFSQIAAEHHATIRDFKSGSRNN
jgi:hypothetical protein